MCDLIIYFPFLPLLPPPPSPLPFPSSPTPTQQKKGLPMAYAADDDVPGAEVLSP